MHSIGGIGFFLIWKTNSISKVKQEQVLRRECRCKVAVGKRGMQRDFYRKGKEHDVQTGGGKC